jgi:hypothetical protein
MKIIDLAPEHEEIYCQCLEEWSDEIREAGGHKRAWYAGARDRGLRVKLAVDDKGTVGGMIQHLPRWSSARCAPTAVSIQKNWKPSSWRRAPANDRRSPLLSSGIKI